MIENKQQAVDFVYRSYMKAEKYLEYNLPDSKKRNPLLTRSKIAELSKDRERNVLITGSKGKGSVAKMLSVMLWACGKKTGLLTSPHITDFNERISVDNKYISDEELIDACNEIFDFVSITDDKIAENEYISPVGIQAMLALVHFSANKTAYNVFECGKGAKYDDVNNILHNYSIINTIFAEHTRELGSTVKEIALDKAEIITPYQKCAYTAEQSAEVMAVLEKRAEAVNVSLKAYGKDFCCRNISFCKQGMRFDVITSKREYCDIIIPLLGEHQAKNCALALAVCEDMTEIDENALKKALKTLEWAGRMEIISNCPLTVLDACINEKSAMQVKNVLEKLPFTSLAVVVGIPLDKDYIGVVRVFSEIADKIVLTTTSNKHYRFDKQQLNAVKLICKNAVYFEQAAQAVEFAKADSKTDLICILGTTSLISDIKKLY